jgi:hypothetical protein
VRGFQRLPCGYWKSPWGSEASVYDQRTAL